MDQVLHLWLSGLQATRDFAVEAAQLSEALAQKEEEVQMTGQLSVTMLVVMTNYITSWLTESVSAWHMCAHMKQMVDAWLVSLKPASAHTTACRRIDVTLPQSLTMSCNLAF